MNMLIEFAHTDVGSFLIELVIGSTFLCALASALSQGGDR